MQEQMNGSVMREFLRDWQYYMASGKKLKQNVLKIDDYHNIEAVEILKLYRQAHFFTLQLGHVLIVDFYFASLNNLDKRILIPKLSLVS